MTLEPRRGALLAALLTALVAVPAPAAGQDGGFRGGVFDPPRAAPAFRLQGSTDEPITLGRYRGKVVALTFGFTYCPRICPVTLANLARAFETLGPAARDVQVVFVSVDPERDSPARMREYLGFFNPAFVGATGTPEELDAVQREYGITARKAVSENPKLGYEVHHSTFIYLIDRAGKLRLLMPFGKPPEDLVHDIRLLLK
jgi:protein SCO1/2